MDIEKINYYYHLMDKCNTTEELHACYTYKIEQKILWSDIFDTVHAYYMNKYLLLSAIAAML